MARMMVSGKINDIPEKGNIADPCCGGCMLIAYANVLKSEGTNYQQKILFVGQDIDIIAGLMCYIQLSFLGCRCIIKIGDSLSDPFLDKEPITNKLMPYGRSKRFDVRLEHYTVRDFMGKEMKGLAE